MKIRNLVAASLTALVLCGFLYAGGTTPPELAAQAASADRANADQAIRSLRTMGRPGLDALFEKYAADIERFARTGKADDNWNRIALALDTVAMQKDAYASHLFWYTDLDQAKQAAREQSKPVLTLRLLGHLNEEFSYANSRLFRAVLYPNAEVSKYLRENYILHWRSVRPAPKVTIDFGDGRKIERTLTGNSIHYILDDKGAIIDALPGLYSPKGFLKYLIQGRDVNKIVDGMPKAQRDMALMKYRKLSFDDIRSKRERAVSASQVKLSEAEIDPTVVTINPSAIVAAPVATTKMLVVDEVSILRVYDDFARFEPRINLGDWNKLAKLYSPSPKLDTNSIAFVRRQNARTGLSEPEFNGLFTKLENFISLDTTRNEFLYHTKLYQWLNAGNTGDLEQFNARVYADLFMTPNSDKWLGLYSPDIYTALDGNGFIDK